MKIIDQIVTSTNPNSELNSELRRILRANFDEANFQLGAFIHQVIPDGNNRYTVILNVYGE